MEKKKLITEVPLTGADPVTIVYVFNHLYQVQAWLGNINNRKETKEIEEAYGLIEQAQEKLRLLAEAESSAQQR